MKERIDALVNPKMRGWARKSIGCDIFGAAKRIGIKPERLTDWENGVKKPTIKQAIKMAEVRRNIMIQLAEDESDFKESDLTGQQPVNKYSHQMYYLVLVYRFLPIC